MSNPNLKVTFSIRTKLFVLVLVAFTVLIVATSWQIGNQANRVSLKTIKQSLEQSSIVLETKIDSRFLSIKEVVSGIAKDGRVLPLVFEEESATLQDLSHEFKRVLEFDILFFTNAEGLILARSDRPEAIGRSVAGKSPLFDKALSGEDSQGVIASKGKLLQLVIVPIFDNVAHDVVRGTVALAYEFSDEMAKEIHALTAGEIGFFVFTRNADREIDGVKTTFNTNSQLGENLDSYFAHNKDAWEKIYLSGKQQNDMRINLEGEDFYSAIHHLSNDNSKPLGFVMALRSRSELLKPFLDIQRLVILIGSVCLLGASIFAWVFSQRISRPIIELVSVAKNIQEGKYQKVEGKRRPNDEVGVLYDAVVMMGNSLREKAELENYLAQMSDELNAEEAILIEDESQLVNNDEDDSQDPDRTMSVTPTFATDEDETVITDESTIISKKVDPIQALVNSTIDERYHVLRRIGAGGIGTVFLAHDVALDENVAIKIMPKKFFSQQESINFKEEIRLARQITHRNILRTFDFGSWQDFYYITMEYISGYDLGALLNTKGAFDTYIGVIMARQICSAMNAAHEQGIIHRDLKPSNMMINRQGILKIMDFGLAMKIEKSKDKKGRHKLKNVAGKGAESETQTATIAGTPRYMAPEQFYNWTLDERTDIYAIGTILYSVFNGKPPFSSKNIEKLARMHLQAKPPEIEGKGGDFPSPLQDIILKSLEKKPEDRYQSVREILDDLNTISS